MQPIHTALNQLSSAQCEDAVAKKLLEDFSSSYLEALESDCEHNPEIDAVEISTEFLNVISSTLVEGTQLKERLSRDDIKTLILGLVRRSNCNPCPCLTGKIAEEKLNPLLDKLIPNF